MDWVDRGKKIPELIKKYRYPILILVIGLIFMAIPTRKAEKEPTPTTPVTAKQESTLDKELESLLSQIKGAGSVRVMLTISTGEETVYQTNEETRTGGDSGSVSHSTVTITDAERSQSGLIRQVNPPVYLGAVVLCQGADSPAVRLAITEAVSKITGLGADRISVLKMK